MHEASTAKRYVVGVCAMQKKTSSKPMREILRRLEMRKQFDLLIFDDETILHAPIEHWPHCDALISFYSSGFPLHKAEQYVNSVRPVLVNDLQLQRMLFDRRLVYAMLEQQGVPVPRHAIANRDPGEREDEVEEADNYVVINGVRINKPFVEKPVDAEDHNVYIYYPTSAGGGSKRLFRKIGDRSSEFYPDCNRIRRNGSYIYEEFLNTQGTDVKVYTVGSSYAHAEARKSPVLDGRVQRDSAGKEVRYPVILDSTEKEIARKVCLAFHQTVCGFDLLRVRGTSYVCDVNGWSFVKNSKKYYDDCGLILHNYLVSALRLRYFRLRRSGSCSSLLGTCPQYAMEPNCGSNCAISPGREWTRPTSGSDASESSVSSSASGAYDDETKEELRCVIAIVRHGDRTPKQKLKTVVWANELVEFYRKRCTTPGREAVKVKAVAEMQELLDLVRNLIAAYTPDGAARHDHGAPWEVGGGDSFEKFVQLKRVLERWKFSGINRKVQFKPRFHFEDEAVTAPPNGREELLMIIKWGGDLTDMGKRQGEELGNDFRNRLYPVEEGGLLRLHSTFRHDLKLYTSDEGRVQMTAAAFAKGFLQLEGDLTPILVSLVTTLGKDANKMLDHSGQEGATEEILRTKAKLKRLLQQPYASHEELVAALAPLKTESILKALKAVGPPLEALGRLHALVGSVQNELRELAHSAGADARFPLYRGETLSLMSERWDKLLRDLRSAKTGEYDLSKIPDVYDCIKYDMLHNAHVGLHDGRALLQLAENLANLYVPQEYGMELEEKQSIGIQISQALCAKIRADIVAVMPATSSDTESQSSSKLGLANGISNGHSGGHHNSTASAFADDDAARADCDAAEQMVEHLGYRLDPTYAKELRIKSPSTQVRTRLYFTSESHLYALLNVLRYQCASWRARHQNLGGDYGTFDVSTEEETFSNRVLQAMGIKVNRCMPRRKYMFRESKMISDSGNRALDDVAELNYLAHVVIRVFETTVQSEESEDRFRVEISFSPGVTNDLDLGMSTDADAAASATASTASTSSSGSGVAAPIYLTKNMTGVLFEEMLAACVSSVQPSKKR